MTWPTLALIIVVLLLAALIVLAVRPMGIAHLAAHPRPSKSYAESVQRVTARQAQEVEGYNPVCQTKLLTHGAPTARAVILVHGYTECPEQFVPLGRLFFDRGANVLIARLPHHGRADRLTDEHAGLRAEELAAYADEVVDIAVGLGQRVTMLGLSAGGVTTAWAAQNRPELDRAVVVSAALAYTQIPAPLTVLAMNLFLLLPNVFQWWDPVLKANISPAYSYPRFASHAIMNLVRLGYATRAAAAHRAPAARAIVVVTNPHDDKVDSAPALSLLAAWQAAGTAQASHYAFPIELGLPHDLIDADDPAGRPDVVYPKLLELADGA